VTQLQTDPVALYISLTSASVSLASLMTTILTFRLNFKASVRPVLIFEYVPQEGWHLKNVGQGPALNVIVVQQGPSEWFHPVRVPPLSKDAKTKLVWCLHDNEHALGAIYVDEHGGRYSSKCHNDLSTTRSGWEFGPWKEQQIGRLWANGEVVLPSSDLR
jgi:hypothetical protein